MPLIKDPIEVLKVPMPFKARLHLTKWKSFNDSLRRWKFRNGVSDIFVVSTHAMRLEINRFMVVTAQTEVEVVETVDDENVDHAADAIFGASPLEDARDDETKVVERPGRTDSADAASENPSDQELHLHRPLQEAAAKTNESE